MVCSTIVDAIAIAASRYNNNFFSVLLKFIKSTRLEKTSRPQDICCKWSYDHNLKNVLHKKIFSSSRIVTVVVRLQSFYNLSGIHRWDFHHRKIWMSSSSSSSSSFPSSELDEIGGDENGDLTLVISPNA